MLDNGAQQCVAHSKHLEGLNLEVENLGDKGPLITGVEGSKPIRLENWSELKLVSIADESKSIKVGVYLITQPGQWYARTCQELPKWLHRDSDKLADPRILEADKHIPIHVILDSDQYNSITSYGVEYRKEGLSLRDTIFGHVVSGRYKPYFPENAYESGSPYPAFSILSSDPEYLTIFGDEHVGQKVEWHHAVDAFDIYGAPYSSELEADTTAEEFLTTYMSQLKILPCGRIEAPLIINPSFRGELSTNEHLKIPRHERNLRIIKQDTPDSRGYKKAMDKIISTCCEVVTDEQFQQLKASGRNWSKLPIHPVVNLDSVSTPYRPVMDASAFEKGYQSLNKYLLSGPNIMPLLQNILRRFQVAPALVIADIKKAFLQMSIREEERDLLLEEQKDGSWKSVLYRFHRLPWGLISAPFILNATVRFLYQKYAQEHPEYADIIKDLMLTTYVDDINSFADKGPDAQLKIKVARWALEPAHMRVTKFRSHPKHLAVELIQEFEPGGPPSVEEFKILGMWYNTTTDQIWCAFEHIHDFDSKGTLQKRHIAGIVARIFDPLGLLSPFTMVSKLMWQQFLLDHPRASWDTAISDKERQIWEEQISEAEKLKGLRFPRKLIDETADKHLLRSFSDASAKSLAACSYCIPVKDGKLGKPRLVGGVTKIVNSSQQERDKRTNEKFAIKHADDSLREFAPAINRLELSAATMSITFTEKIAEIAKIDPKDITYWTDSENVIRLINKGGNSAFITRYNQKRVDKILSRSSPSQWRHVEGKKNPADIASRGTPKAHEFLNSSLWLDGPEFITQDPSEWPKQKEELTFQENPELKTRSGLVTSVTEEPERQNKIENSIPLECGDGDQNNDNPFLFQGTDWKSSCLLAREFLENIPIDDPDWGEIKRGMEKPIPRIDLFELLVVWEAQQNTCKELLAALRSGKIPAKLRNFITYHNLQVVKIKGLEPIELIVSVKRNIRESTKLQETMRRTYLPNGRVNRRNFKRNGHLEKLNEALKALKTRDMLAFVPPWSVAAKQLVKHVHEEVTAYGSFHIVEMAIQQLWFVPRLSRLYKRVRRSCVNCRFMDTQPAPLPEGNLLAERCVNQYPFEVTGVDFTGPFDVLRKKRQKLDVCIFACPYSRAISLQVMPNREYNSFLQAFEKFKHLRGVRPILNRSDNEKTFLTRADQERLRNQCFETEWRFNPPQSPNFGGTYERLIKMVKEKYARCFNRQRFDSITDFEVAISYLEYVINNRPLFTQKDPITQKLVIIRPSHFIHPGHPDQFDHEISNLFSARTEMASKEGLLEQGLTRLNKFKKRLKLLFDETYVNMLRKVHLNKLYSRKEDPRLAIQVGDAVLIKPTAVFKETSVFTKMHWPIGHVLKVYFDESSQRIKNLDVMYFDEKLQRDRELKRISVSHFAPLELKIDEAMKFAKNNPSRTVVEEIQNI
jgi:hypothetical protein